MEAQVPARKEQANKTKPMAKRFHSLLSTIVHCLAICLMGCLGMASSAVAQVPLDGLPIDGSEALDGLEAIEGLSPEDNQNLRPDLFDSVPPGLPGSIKGGPADPDAKPPELTDQQKAFIETAIEELASDQFATRERAATRLSELGRDAIFSLRQAAKSSPDPEVRLRTGEIVRQMTSGDMQSKIEDFIAGKDVDFKGWRIARTLMGDTTAVRELFVGLLTQHPELMESMDGTSRDRAIAVEKVLTTIQNKMFVQREFPNRADTFAILIGLSLDNRVAANASYEGVLLSVLQKEAASRIMKDAQLSVSFKMLLNRWMIQSSLANREDILLVGMAWKLDSTLPLAIQTLVESKQPHVIACSMQAIARFGDQRHVELLHELLDDQRLTAERPGFIRGKEMQTKLGDVAMVAIAILTRTSTDELGLGKIDSHPTFGFLLSDVGFPVDDPESRTKARAKVEKIIANAPEAK